jgi:hypothetical protein
MVEHILLSMVLDLKPLEKLPDEMLLPRQENHKAPKKHTLYLPKKTLN